MTSGIKSPLLYGYFNGIEFLPKLQQIIREISRQLRGVPLSAWAQILGCNRQNLKTSKHIATPAWGFSGLTAQV